MRLFGPAFLRDQPRQTALLKRRLRLIKRWPGNAKDGSRFGDRVTVFLHPAEHFVLHLQQIARIEKVIDQKQTVANLLGMRIEGGVRFERPEPNPPRSRAPAAPPAEPVKPPTSPVR